MSVGQKPLTKFIGIWFIYHNKSCLVPRGLWREDIAYTLIREVAGDCDCPPRLEIECYLSHITRNERYNWCGFSEGSVLWTLERWIPHVSVGDTPPERFIAICLTPFSILRGRVFPFLHGRWAGRECRTALCSSRGLDL